MTSSVTAAGTRPWSRALTAAAVAAVTWAVLALAVRDALAAAIADGVTVLGLTVPDFAPATATQQAGRVLLVVGVLVAVAAAATVRWPGGLRRLYLREGPATDLAVLRIAVFGLLLVLPRVPEAIRLSGFAEALRDPVAVMPWLLDVVPTAPGTVRLEALVFWIACVLAVLGLWTRVATVVAAVLGLHLLGIPQFFGKVSHYHHLWWAAALLAAAPCGDALSLDSARRAWRSPGARPGRELRGVRYGLPLRLLWSLLGLVYFFPGLWKFASAGLEWALSDNLRFVMYEHWSRLQGFTPPPVPIDEPPLLYAVGLAVLAFELGFILLVHHRVTRPWAAVVGLLFHLGNWVALRLGFFTLQVLYVCFVPWQRVAGWLGQRRAPLHVQVRGATTRAARLVAAADAADPFGPTTREVVPDAATPLAVAPSQDVRRAALRVVRRSPVLWPAIPVLAVVPARRLSAWLDATPAAGEPRPLRRGVGGVRATAWVGGALLAGNVLVGLFAVGQAWPVASYPAFAGIEEPTIDRLSLALTDSSGDRRVLAAAELRNIVSWEKYDGLTRPLLREPANADRVAGLLEVLRGEGVEVPADGTVTVLRDRLELTRDGGELVERTELATLDLATL